MNRQELVARAKAILNEAYEEAAYLIAEWREKRPSEDLTALCKEIDEDNWNGLRRKVQRAQAHRNASGEAESAARRTERARKQRSEAKSALKDPKQRKQVIRDLPREQREELIEAAHDATVEEIRAERAEHSTESTARELMGGDEFDPAEYWADTLIIRVNRNARELAAKIKQAGGLLFGTMSPEEAFDYLHEAERLIAEARAAAQEQVRDRTEV